MGSSLRWLRILEWFGSTAIMEMKWDIGFSGEDFLLQWLKIDRAYFAIYVIIKAENSIKRRA
jgi:hypothetical protein